MKFVMIIVIAFVLLIPTSIYAEMNEFEKQVRGEIQTTDTPPNTASPT
jgi:hypothetical protein